MKTLLAVLLFTAPAFAQHGFKFVSVDRGVFTLEQGHTVIRAKCRGRFIKNDWLEGSCPLGEYRPGDIIPEIDYSKCVNPHAPKTIDCGEWIEVTTDVVNFVGREAHGFVILDVLSWKQKTDARKGTR